MTEIVDVTVGLAAADDEKKAKNTEKLNGWCMFHLRWLLFVSSLFALCRSYCVLSS